jgi:hypothetical protein
MDMMNLQEAQLFRLLGEFFGPERVVWSMSVTTVCGDALAQFAAEATVKDWISRGKCLFTIVDDDDSPRMVVEFGAFDGSSLDLQRFDRQRFLPTVLAAAGIKYVVLTDQEFAELTNPGSSLDLFALLEDKVLGDADV